MTNEKQKTTLSKIERYAGEHFTSLAKYKAMKQILKDYPVRKMLPTTISEIWDKDDYQNFTQITYFEAYHPVTITAQYRYDRETETDSYTFYLSYPELKKLNSDQVPNWVEEITTFSDINFPQVMDILNFLFMVYASDNQ